MKSVGMPLILMSGSDLRFTYRNWRGEIRERHALPLTVWFGSTEYHPDPQWLMAAIDLERPDGQTRDFAMRDMSDVRWASATAGNTSTSAADPEPQPRDSALSSTEPRVMPSDANAGERGRR